MPWTIPTKKPYHERKGRPSLIWDGGGLPTRGKKVSMNNGGGKPFGNGGNDPPRGGGSDLLRGSNSGPLRDQNPKSYIVGPPRPWIGPT
jgi:hypothetical protein